MTKTKKSVAAKEKSKAKLDKTGKVTKPSVKPNKKAKKNPPESRASGSGKSKPAKKAMEENNNVVYDRLLIFDIKLPTETTKYNPFYLVIKHFIKICIKTM